MSEKSTASIITSKIISPPSLQTNSNEIVQEDDVENLENGGWEDDYTDNEEDAESMKEWETLEFLCQISKTRSNKNDYNEDGNSDNGDAKNEISDFISKSDKYNEDGNLEKGDENDDVGDSNDSAVERNGTGKKMKGSENSKNRENNGSHENGENSENNESNENCGNSEIKPDIIAPSADNIEQPSSPHQSNIENRKRRASENDGEIDVATLFQKHKKQKDDLETKGSMVHK